MKKIFTIALVVTVILGIKGYSQDIHFSQFYSNPIYLAPSFAGSSHSTRFVGAYRDQWPQIPGNFISYSFSVDHYLKDFKSGFAISAICDNAGQGKLVTNNIGASYSYNIRLSRKVFLQPGLAVYYYSRKVDYSSINFSDEYFENIIVGPSSENLPFEKVRHADFAVSSLLYTYNYWLGFNLDHLMSISPVLRSNIKYTDMRLMAFGGYKFPIKHRVRSKNDEYIHAAFNYRLQSTMHQLDLGLYYNRNPFMVGVWYRGFPVLNENPTSSALIYMFGLKFDNLNITYSFDMSLGKLISQTGGAHEITVSYFIKQSSRPKRQRTIPCPEI